MSARDAAKLRQREKVYEREKKETARMAPQCEIERASERDRER